MATKIVMTEKCDKKVAFYVLNNIDKIEYRLIDDINYNPKAMLESYLKMVLNTKDGSYSVMYTNKNEGRLFCKGFALQNMLREYRHTLFNNIYYDIDIKNCHPVILEQYCLKNNIHAPELKTYNSKRELIFKHMIKKGKSKDEIKKALLKIMNGGKLDEGFAEFTNLDNELKTIQKVILILNKDIETQVKKEKKTFNIEGSVLNLLLCKIENKIINEAMNFFNKNNFTVGALCFDGLCVEKNKEITENILSSLDKYIEKATDYKVNFIIKSMDEGLKINVNELEEYKNDIIIDNDEEGANYIISQLNNTIIKSNGRVFIKKFDNANIYYEDESHKFSNSKDLLLQKILKLSLKKANGNVIENYSKNLRDAKSLVDATFSLIDNDEDFISKMWNSNLKKLCFKNGYYDFNDKAFKNYDNDTFTLVYINLNYNENVDEKYTNILNDKILNKILFNNDMRQSFLNWCARGLSGEYTDKSWSVGLGFRNSGKSVITELFLETFNSYCGTFSGEELLCNRVGCGDVAKKLSFLLPFEFRRLNFSNELKSTDDSGRALKLDGNIIKSVSSGGDTKKARKNFKDEVSFKIQGRMCLFMNDLIKTDPIDATETLTIFEFMSIFKKEISPEEEIINNQVGCNAKYFLKDDTIKQLIKDDNIKHALIKIIINSYYEEININNNVNDFVENDDNLNDDIKNHYEITLNGNDKITVNDVNEYNKENLIKYSKSKIKQTLCSLGACEKFIKIDKKAVRYYVGIKFNNN
jgi:hypothetical protein